MSAQLFQTLMFRLQFDNEEGQDLAEYALIIVLVSIAAIAALTVLSGGISGVMDQINAALGGA